MIGGFDIIDSVDRHVAADVSSSTVVLEVSGSRALDVLMRDCTLGRRLECQYAESSTAAIAVHYWCDVARSEVMGLATNSWSSAFS